MEKLEKRKRKEKNERQETLDEQGQIPRSELTRPGLEHSEPLQLRDLEPLTSFFLRLLVFVTGKTETLNPSTGQVLLDLKGPWMGTHE